MKRTGMLIILMAIHFYAAAQSTQTVKVNAGDDIAAAISSNGIYRFPSFVSGDILLKNGNHGTQLLNYNILSDQMMYIDKKGDTLAIGIPDQIQKIIISDTGFYYYKKGCVEEIAYTPTASLVVERKVSVHYQKKGAFGNSNGVGTGIESYTMLPAAASTYHLTVNEDAVIRKAITYFLFTSEGSLLPANKNNLIRLFPKNKENIESWLNTHKINFNKQSDLADLFGVAAAGN